MNGGKKPWLVALSFAAAGCASTPNTVEVRPIADPGSKMRAGSDSLADAKGQLALGNVGLALEGFRKASRNEPNNAEAFAGMAACYELMRRYDLAQSNYEAALALAPRNADLLAKLASALEQQGRAQDAADVRAEVAQLAAADAVLDQAQPDAEPMVPAVAASQPAIATKSVSIALATAPIVAAPTVVAAPPKPTAPATPVTAVPSAPRVTSVKTAEPHLSATPLADQTSANLLAGLAASLSPVGFAPLVATLMAPSAAAAPPIPAPRIREHAKVAMTSESLAPRLERLSLGEVALLTGTGTAWRGQVVSAAPQKVTVKWVPMTQVAAARPNIRLLNAARVQGLAARNRDYLFDRGWRKIQIGDASATRDRSLVLYPALRPQLGRILAAQFGFRAQPTDSSEAFLVLLGRDAPNRTAQNRG